MNSHVDKLTAKYNALLKDFSPLDTSTKIKYSEVAHILQSLDSQGRWISIHDGQRLVGQAKFPLHAQYLSSAVFSKNLTKLSEFLKTK